MPRWRVVVHALDRTGPPVLARAFLRWLGREHGDEVDVVAFRGGELLDDFLALAPVRVVVDPEEAEPLATERIEALRRRVGELPEVDATLLVSIASGRALPFLGASSEPIVTWVVEQGEAFPDGVAERSTRWLAGSVSTRDELVERVEAAAGAVVTMEFVDGPVATSEEQRRRCRLAMGAGGDELLVVAAGIATPRKAPDLFLELALAHRRAGGPPARFTWIGGERDLLFHHARTEADRLGLDEVRFVGNVADVGPWLAAADVFVHPARLDSFPLVCLHAAAAGTPVVAFGGVGGVPEMFGPTFEGVDYPDVVGLAGVVGTLADAERRRAVGTAQREHVLARYVADVGAPRIREQLLLAAGATG